MKTKDEVQSEAGIAIDINNGKGIIAMATGTGKSKVAIDYIAKEASLNFELDALIVVPTEKLRDETWREEFIKWNQEFLWSNNVERSCYASISKIEGRHFNVVILDEGHNITENNSRFFEQNTIDHIVLLTATPPKKLEKIEILNRLDLRVIYEISLDEAVAWGLVSPYKITVIYTTLDSVCKNVKSGTKAKPFFQTEFNSYLYLSTKIFNSPNKYLILKRMRLIYDSVSKTDAAKWLLDNYIPKDERTLIFAGTIRQAQVLCENSYHSKSAKTDLSYNRFMAEEINRLSSVRSLNEGQNIPNLNNALIVQLNSNDLDMIQRIGRVVRYREDHLANIIIVVMKETVDEKWLASALSRFDREKIEYLDYSLLKLNKDGNQFTAQTNIAGL